MSKKAHKKKPKTTEPTKRTGRPDAVSYTEFVKLWKTSSSVSAVAKALSIKANSASAIASRLRRSGVHLRKFPRRPAQAIDKKLLNRISTDT